VRWLRHWGPAIAWGVAIWLFSTEAFSPGATSRYILPVLKLLLPGAPLRTLLQVHEWIRKTAHVVEYFILSLLILRGIRGDGRGWRLTWGLATVAIVVSYAAFDEVHQAFVPGRGASAMDVARDAFGAASAQLWAWWLARRRQKRIDARTGVA